MPTYRKELHALYTQKHFDHSTRINGEDIALCYYCNSIAYHRDHVPPLKYMRDQVMQGNYEVISKFDLLVVPACKPCNLNLAAKPLLTLKARKEYICVNFPKRLAHKRRSAIRKYIDSILGEESTPECTEQSSKGVFILPRNLRTKFLRWFKQFKEEK